VIRSSSSSQSARNKNKKNKKTTTMTIIHGDPRDDKSGGQHPHTTTTTTTTTTIHNIFRDTPLRYLGYANEVGESFRSQFPRGVVPSYLIAATYCGADAIRAGWLEYQQQQQQQHGQDKGGPRGGVGAADTTKPMALSTTTTMMTTTLDTLVWQLLASVLIPGATINGVVRIAKLAVGGLNNSHNHTTTTSTTTAAGFAQRWIPTTIGLLAIPLIVHPIDRAVDYIMDETIRPYFLGVVVPSRPRPSS
jgi:mitochondrial fission process protein 1